MAAVTAADVMVGAAADAIVARADAIVAAAEAEADLQLLRPRLARVYEGLRTTKPAFGAAWANTATFAFPVETLAV